MTTFRYISLLLLILSVTGLNTFAQTVIQGNISNSAGNACPLLNVIVSSVENPNIAIAFCTSDNEGNYTLSFGSESDSVLIQIRGLNIRTESKAVKNVSSRHNFTVKEQVWEIKEVTVNANKLYSYGDTVNYNVDAYTAESDISIGDVLKKMPGITVTPSGQIQYMGKSIKKFYIEGLDLLKGRYGLATNNISPKDISTVQVFENHQDIEALKDLRYEDRASINLKLKEGVKGVFKLLGVAGAGFDNRLLWDNGLTGMFFGRSHQHFSTYKGNNSGVDLAVELRSFSDDDYGYTLQATSIRLPAPPAIDKNNYYFNNSNSGSLNNLFKVKNGDEFGVNIIFLNDYEQRNSTAKTVYMLPDKRMIAINETLSSAMNTNLLSGEISYKKNEKKMYVNETLSFSGRFDGGHGTVNTEDTVHQETGIETVRIRNKLHLIKRTDDAKGFEIFSTVNVEEKPQNLYVTPSLFANTLGGNYSGMLQYSKITNINIRNSASLLSLLRLGEINIHSGVFFNFNRDGLTGNLSAFPNNLWNSNTRFINDTRYSRMETGVTLNADYNPNRMKFHIYLPLQYRYLHLIQEKQQKELLRNKMVFTPHLNIQYIISHSSEISANYAISSHTPSILNLYGGYILNSYRTLSAYEATLHESQMQTASFRYGYKNIFRMFFSGITISYSYYKPEVLYGNRFSGMIIETVSQNVNTSGQQYSASLKAGKGWNWKNLKIGIETEWYRGNNPLLVQDETVRSKSEAIYVNGDFSLRPFTFLGLNCDGRYGESRNRLNGGDEFSVRTATGRATANVTLPIQITLSANVHTYYNSMAVYNKWFTLTGMELTYTRWQTRFGLEWDNIFNIHNYAYSVVSNLTSYYSEYRIRPMSVVFKVRFKII